MRWWPFAVLALACAEPQHPPPQTAPVEKPAPQAEPAKPAKPKTAAVKPRPETKTSEPPTEAPLDLEGLVQRLKDTKAIGVFTKVALKNQVDDLLGEFRDVYDGKSGKAPADLRGPYDQLVMKVLAVLQDKDPALAKDIVASRERIWSFLADRESFLTI